MLLQVLEDRECAEDSLRLEPGPVLDVCLLRAAFEEDVARVVAVVTYLVGERPEQMALRVVGGVFLSKCFPLNIVDADFR